MFTFIHIYHECFNKSKEFINYLIFILLLIIIRVNIFENMIRSICQSRYHIKF